MEKPTKEKKEQKNDQKMDPAKKDKIITYALYGLIALAIVGYLIYTIKSGDKDKTQQTQDTSTTIVTTEDTQQTLKTDPYGYVQVGGEQSLPNENKGRDDLAHADDNGYHHSAKNVEWIDDPAGKSAACQITIPLGFTINRAGNTIYIKPEDMKMDGVTSSGPITVAWFDAAFMYDLYNRQSDTFASSEKNYTVLKKYQCDTGNGVRDCYYLKCEWTSSDGEETYVDSKYIIAIDYKMSDKFLLVTCNSDSVQAMLTGRYATIDELMLAILPEA